MTESDRFVEMHNEIKSLLDVKDFNSVNNLMGYYCNDDSSCGDLKTILVITKSFKNNEIICDTRKKIVQLLENKLGEKLI